MYSLVCPLSRDCSAPTDAPAANRIRDLLKGIKRGLFIIDRRGILYDYFSSNYFAILK